MKLMKIHFGDVWKVFRSNIICTYVSKSQLPCFVFFILCRQGEQKSDNQKYSFSFSKQMRQIIIYLLNIELEHKANTQLSSKYINTGAI